MNHDPNDPTLPQRPRPVSPHPQVIPRDAVWVEEPEPELNVMDYAHLVWAHKWLILGVLAATLVLTAAWSMTRPKLYRAESKHSARRQLRDESIELSKLRLDHDRLQREYEQNRAFLEGMLARSKEADTPPTATVTDPVMCARLVDMVLLVVQYAGPKRQLVREAIRLLSRTGVRIVGVLLNKVDLERDAHYYSGYYSYYHYGDRPASGDVKKGRKRAG